jgi:N-acetylneuraminate synthase
MELFVDFCSIGNRVIGTGRPVFVIAEAGVNHNGDPAIAKEMITVAAAARADAVKFQSFHADSLVTRSGPKAVYQVDTTAADESHLEMLRRLQLPEESQSELQKCCEEAGIIYCSTPFDEASADFLDSLDIAFFKIGSGDLTNLPLLQHVARKKRPIILSTGMANMTEVEQAVTTVRDSGCIQLALLQCVSNYPAQPADVNLRSMQTMSAAFGVPVGYSDHTLGTEVALAATALGACIIEKHFTLDRRMSGPDHQASLQPEELTLLIEGIRKVEQAMGSGEKGPSDSEKEMAKVARRSLVAACDIPAGTKVTRQMIAVKRPGTGLTPSFIEKVVGRSALTNINADALLTLDMFG